MPPVKMVAWKVSFEQLTRVTAAEKAFYMEDMLTCHCRESSGVIDNINDGGFIFRTLVMLAQCHTAMAYKEA